VLLRRVISGQRDGMELTSRCALETRTTTECLPDTVFLKRLGYVRSRAKATKGGLYPVHSNQDSRYHNKEDEGSEIAVQK